MENRLLPALIATFIIIHISTGKVSSQTISSQINQTSLEEAHSVLPSDGVLEYLPKDSSNFIEEEILPKPKVNFKPLINFYFRPEVTSNYKEAGMKEDTGHLNFYLRGDIGGRIGLPKSIDMVFNLQSYGQYTRSLGPLDPNLTLYEAYVDMKSLDRDGQLSLRFGRMSLGKYGTEMLVGDDDFIKGRSFESVRLRYTTDRTTSDVMWVQLYQQAPDTAGFEWNHPILLGTFNTFQFSDAFTIDANLPYIIDQYNSGFRTSVLMPDIRFHGQSNSLRYSAEFIYQTGLTRGIIADTKLGDVSAYAMEIAGGYFVDDKFSAELSYYRASGDDQPGDEEIKSYNVLWQNEHRRFGYIDAFKGSNLQAVTFHLNWNIGRLWATGIHGVYASVLEQKDRSTGIATIPSLMDLGTDSKAIGAGGDWYLNHYFSPYLNMQLSVSAFSPGEYFKAVNGIDDMMMRGYLMLALKI